MAHWRPGEGGQSMDRDGVGRLFDAPAQIPEWLSQAAADLRSGTSQVLSKVRRRALELRSDATFDSRSPIGRRLPRPTPITSPMLPISLALFAQSAIDCAAPGPDGRRRLPPGTCAVIAANALVFLKPGGVSSSSVCLAPHRIIERGEFGRLVVSAFVHLDLPHLASNMRSVLESGARVEEAVGCGGLLVEAAYATLLSQGIHVASAWAESRWLGRSGAYYSTGSVGFSSACFALQILAGYLEAGDGPQASATLVSPKFLCWANLILSQILFPAGSLRGHVCGIVAGLIRVYLPRPFLLIRRAAAGLAEGLLGGGMRRGEADEAALRRGRKAGDLLIHLGFGVIALACVVYANARQKAPLLRVRRPL